MKRLVIALLLTVNMVAVAQSSSSTLRTRIADDSKTLSIQLEGDRNGQKIHYDRTFDVDGMSGFQKEVIKYRAFSSQGIPLPLHEMSGLLLVAFGVSALTCTLIIRWYQTRKLV